MCYLAMAEEWGLDKGDKALSQISTHEQVCEQRYLRIEERLKDGSKRFDQLDTKIDRYGNRLWWIMGLIVVSILVPQFIGG
jgi:hypothetical protein|tara:strand:+ start:186 stop:428 length:243 start_codon:yes stop_codon:yes gene_type:complete